MAQSEQPINILELLDGMEFPATVIELVAYAEDQGASEDALEEIRALPDEDYQSIHDIALHLNRIEQLPQPENQWPSAPAKTGIPPDEESGIIDRSGQARGVE
jgi:hypothetical protein